METSPRANHVAPATVVQQMNHDDAGEKIAVDKRAALHLPSRASHVRTVCCVHSPVYGACTSSGMRARQAGVCSLANYGPQEQPDAGFSPVVLIKAF